MRCGPCPVPRGLNCRGEALRHKCGDARYLAYFARRAEAEAAGEVPPSRPPAAPDGPSHADLLDNADACPHRVPMPEGRRSPCGCRWLCTEGNGPRHRKGGVTLMDCWDCPIAPRLAPGAPPDDA